MRGASGRRRNATVSNKRALPVVRWLQVGAAGAGVGLALAVAPAIASADNGASSAARATSSDSAASSAAAAGARHQSAATRRAADVRVSKVRIDSRATASDSSLPAGSARARLAAAGGADQAEAAPQAAAARSRARSSTAAVIAPSESSLGSARISAPRLSEQTAAQSPVANALGDLAAFFGLPGAPANSNPTLSALPLLVRLQLDDLFGGSVGTTTDPTAVVTGLFQQILRENPTAAELQAYTRVWRLTGVNGVVAGLYSSTQFRQTEVSNFYLELLGRTPTSSELAWNSSALMWGLPEPVLAAWIAGGREFYADSSSGGGPLGVQPSATTFVNLLYRTMVGQTPDQNAAAIYVQQLQAGLPTGLTALKFVTSDAYRAVKIQEIYQVVFDRTPTTDEVAQYEKSWFFDGGLAGIATVLLASAGNVERIQSGAVALPDMQAAAQLQQLLLAQYTTDPDGFVSLMNTLLNADEAHPCSETSATCNTALYKLLVNGGTDRGIPNSSMQVTPISANVASLIPTQNEIDMMKSLRPLQDPVTLEQYMAGGTVLHVGGAVITADDGTYIIDGHHRWSAIYIINPYAQVSAVDVGYVPSPQDALEQTQIGVAAELGYLKTSSTSGDNLFTVDRATFVTTANSLILGGDPVTVLKDFTKFLGLDPAATQDEKLAAIDDYLWSNVLRMRQYNNYVPGATNRDVMPQAEPQAPILQYLQSGALSYSFPTISYLG